MELIKLNNNNYCCIDYAHTPDALESALKELRQSFDGKLWCVFGCGGNRDKLKRPLMGAIAEEYADVTVLTNDNPRLEDENLIFKEILSGVKEPNNVLTLADRREAILYSLDSADQNNSRNIVLVAGKGHETYQEINDKTFLFDDREVIDKYLSEQNVE
jgi:UDP-N-acetylmuramoyl-L-alanyl-D-glutamate--2,6-diaminopimelate ligase|tara:strand:+ start:175 stop:651 length:477 start_codon:yes stop_codon:yes gene_type:complete